MTMATPGAEIARIERALGALLTAMVEDEARWPEPALFHIKATPFDPSKVVRSRAEMEIGQLLQEPVYFACRLAVRRLGERLHAVASTEVVEIWSRGRRAELRP